MTVVTYDLREIATSDDYFGSSRVTTDISQNDSSFPAEPDFESHLARIDAHIREAISDVKSRKPTSHGDELEQLLRLAVDSKSSHTDKDIRVWAQKLAEDVSNATD